MRELEQLQQYELILTVRSPLFVGSGQSYQSTEYIYDRRSNRVSVLHRNRFIRFLVENNLADSYERFILGGSTNLHSFLRQECGLDEAGIRELCVYDLPAGDALDAEHSLKNIQAFMRDNAFRPYVPGSSVKGALRTVLLYRAMQEQGILGTRNWRDYSKEDGIPEREYLNTLRFSGDHNGKTRLDAVSSLLRGVLVSDSEPIPDSAMTLTGKRDAAFGGAGFFAKSLAYPYYGEEQALHEVSAYMHRTFRGHYHQYDEGWGDVAPHDEIHPVERENVSLRNLRGVCAVIGQYCFALRSADGAPFRL